MGLINYVQLEDGFEASANLWNERFGKIYAEFNGHVGTSNLENEAVTTEKIAPGAVTSDKLDVSVSIDDNGWTVKDFGSNKVYTKRFTDTISVPLTAESNYNVLHLALPVGVTDISTVSVNTNFFANDRCFIIGGWNATNSTELNFSISNWMTSSQTLTSYVLDVTLQVL